MSSSCSFGNIENVDTTGASKYTARKMNESGVAASEKMAKDDMKYMNKYKSMIQEASRDLGMDASVIAGIMSRETRAGSVLPESGYGFDGHGFGLMQVDDRYHKPGGGPYSLQHIKQGTQILINMINDVKRKHPTWTQDQALKGGISAYNAGVKNVRVYERMDVGTTGDDYANDVVARSKYFKRNGC